MSDQDTCLACKYFAMPNKDDQVGLCWRYPPPVPVDIKRDKHGDVIMSRLEKQIVVDYYDWCGEFAYRDDC